MTSARPSAASAARPAFGSSRTAPEYVPAIPLSTTVANPIRREIGSHGRRGSRRRGRDCPRPREVASRRGERLLDSGSLRRVDWITSAKIATVRRRGRGASPREEPMRGDRAAPRRRAPSGAGRARATVNHSGSAGRARRRGRRREVDPDEHRGGDQEPALDQRVVAGQDRGCHETPEAGDRKHRLDHDRAGEDQAHADPEDGHDRDHGVPERVTANDPPRREPLGSGGADVVLAERLRHRRAGDAGEEPIWSSASDAAAGRRPSQAPGLWAKGT